MMMIAMRNRIRNSTLVSATAYVLQIPRPLLDNVDSDVSTTDDEHNNNNIDDVDNAEDIDTLIEE